MVEIVTLNGDVILNREQLHGILAVQLELPAWYGGNLDALMDCLTDLNRDVHIHIVSYNKLEEHLESYAARLLQVLRRAEKENSHLTLTVD